jgi:ABC-type tungstate transport system permease subunit
MGLTFRLGQVPLAVFTDSSNNVGIGASANASFKLQVTGATNLTGALTASTATFESSGSGNTFLINHTSGSGIALTITKGGNGEGLIINKTSGTRNWSY